MAAEDYIHPEGLLQDNFLPEQDLTAHVTTWEAKAVTQATAKGLSGDTLLTATEAYVYWRGYKAAAELMLSEPNSHSTPDDQQKGFSEAQYRYWVSQANYYKAIWDDLMEAPPPPTGRQTFSHVVPNVPVW